MLLDNFRYQINTAKNVLDSIVSIQPKEGSTLSGETREAVVFRLAADMLNKIPMPYVDHEVSRSRLLLKWVR